MRQLVLSGLLTTWSSSGIFHDVVLVSGLIPSFAGELSSGLQLSTLAFMGFSFGSAVFMVGKRYDFTSWGHISDSFLPPLKDIFPPPSPQLDSGTMSPRIPSRRMLCFYKDFQTHCIGMYITVYAWFLPKDQLTVTFEGQISWFATVFGKINLGLVAHGVLRGVYYVHVLWGSPVVKRQQKQQKQQMQS